MSNVIAFTTPVFRVSYARVWEPSVFANKRNYNVQEAIAAGMGDRLAYTLVAYFPKSPAAYPQGLDPSLRVCDLTQITHQAFYAAMEHPSFGPMFQASGNQWPAGLLYPLTDCDLDPEDRLKPECQGMMSMKMTSPAKGGVGKLQIVDQNVQPILDRNAFYSGCWARAYGIMWAYDNMSKGVRFTLNCLQKVADGTPFGGGAQAATVFGAVPGAAPGMPAMGGMPGAPAAPAGMPGAPMSPQPGYNPAPAAPAQYAAPEQGPATSGYPQPGPAGMPQAGYAQPGVPAAAAPDMPVQTAPAAAPAFPGFQQPAGPLG